MQVRAKKSLGQHFLNDLDAAKRIVDGLQPAGAYTKVLEI
ncbi:MAG: rRNA ((1518)-N(6)/adenine(1519)-N(6))-dimethyltransferase, partial [Bacteroidota bacterium]